MLRSTTSSREGHRWRSERYYKEGSDPRDVNHFWFADKFLAGGIQADKWGNANMISLGKPDKMTFRGPGTIGINDVAIGVRDTYFLTAHEKRRLVEQVDFISHPGKKVCRENEYYGDGPKWIVTPKCIFDFDLRPTRRHVPNRTSIHGAPTATSVRRRAGRPSPRSIRAMAKSSPISPNPTREDVEAPVRAALAAFLAWKRRAGAARAKLLIKLAQLVEANAATLAELESLQCRIRDSKAIDAVTALDVLEYFAGMATKIQGEQRLSVTPVKAVPIEPSLNAFYGPPR